MNRTAQARSVRHALCHECAGDVQRRNGAYPLAQFLSDLVLSQDAFIYVFTHGWCKRGVFRLLAWGETTLPGHSDTFSGWHTQRTGSMRNTNQQITAAHEVNALLSDRKATRAGVSVHEPADNLQQQCWSFHRHGTTFTLQTCSSF